MRVLKPSQVNEFIGRFDMPVFGNQDKNKEYIFDMKEKDFFLVRTAKIVELPSGQTTEDQVAYQFFDQTAYEDAVFMHESNDFYPWLGCTVKVLHDPTKGDPEKIDKRSGYKEELKKQHRIATLTK